MSRAYAARKKAKRKVSKRNSNPFRRRTTRGLSGLLGREPMKYARFRTFKNSDGSRTVYVGDHSTVWGLKKDAVRNARNLRADWGLLVRTIPTSRGYINFVSRGRKDRRYNKTQIPFRDFQDPTFGMDTPRLVNWLSMQQEYNADLSWQENLRRIGGDEALTTLAQLQNPEGFMGRMQKQVETEKAIATGWNQMLIDQGFAEEGQLSTETATQLKESDTVFDILGIDDKKDSKVNDDIFNQWFNEGLEEFPTSSQERKNKTRAIEDVLEDKISSEPITQSTPLSRELSDQFSSIFNEAIWGEDDTITRPDGTVIMKPMLEQDMSPTLGFSQPSIEFIERSGGSRGMWTFQPVEAGAWGDPEMQLETRRAWLVADSLGTVIQAYPYEEGEGARADADAFEAIRQAYLFAKEASGSEPYTSSADTKNTAVYLLALQLLMATSQLTNMGNG
jgi:hypothetical protein